MNHQCDLCGRRPGENQLPSADGEELFHICHKCWDIIFALIERIAAATSAVGK